MVHGKDSARNSGDLGLILGLGRSPGGGHGNPFQYSCLVNPRGQRTLVGCSPWGCKESDTTERLSTYPPYQYSGICIGKEAGGKKVMQNILVFHV